MTDNGDAKFDRDRDVLVFLRVPKTGSTSLARMLMRAMGPRQNGRLPDRHIDGLDHGLRRAHDQLRRFGSRLTLRVIGAYRRSRGELDRIPNARFLHGHHPLWAPIATRRRRRHIIVMREPVDRFLSLYFFYRAKAAKRKGGSVGFEKRQIAGEDVNDGISRLLSTVGPKRLNSHCRYLTRSAKFEDARAELRKGVVMAASLDDLDEMKRSLERYVGFADKTMYRRNVGSLRPKANPLSPSVEARLRAALEPDIRLFDYLRENREFFLDPRAKR